MQTAWMPRLSGTTRQWRPWRGSPLAWTVLALLLALGLLVALLMVLQQGVRRGVSLRQAAQQQADVVWRCNAERGRALRDACLQAAAR